jgi:hypothetical protein
MTINLIRDFFLSYTHFRAIGPLLYILHVLFLFYLAQLIGLDLFDLNFENFYTKDLTGARFLTRIFQLYLFKSTLKRFLDILGYNRLSVLQICIVAIILFGPVMLGAEPVLILALPFIPGKGFYFSELKKLKLYYS